MLVYDTELVYLKDSYRKELKTYILDLRDEGEGHSIIFLDATIFYPEGGGQPSDTGKIVGENGTATVVHAKYYAGVVQHRSQIEGVLSPDDDVSCYLDWDRRYWNMCVHTAGHLLHDALMQLVPGAIPVKGHHGNKPFIEYRDPLPSEIAGELENLANRMIADNLQTYTKFVSLDELKAMSRFVPPSLPKDKPLRVFWIEGCDAMPDGGTHVKRTGEIGGIRVVSISAKKGRGRVRYEVVDVEGVKHGQAGQTSGG